MLEKRQAYKLYQKEKLKHPEATRRNKVAKAKSIF
jgi:hypothetical protein